MAAKITFEEFCVHFSTATAWTAKGWQELPKVNGGGGGKQREIKEICSELTVNSEYIVHESKEWFKHAVEIENQKLFQ